VLAEPLNATKLATSSSVSAEHAGKDESPFLNNELLLHNISGDLDRSALISWNLEIRRFSKSDVGCYQCQLNSLQQKVVHYCLKMEGKLSMLFILIILID
jgi:hypothetical protein